MELKDLEKKLKTVQSLKNYQNRVSELENEFFWSEVCQYYNYYHYIYRPRGKESTEVQITQNKGKESENSYQKLKRSQWDRHTCTHGNLIKIFRQAQPSFSIKGEQMFVITRQRWHH